MGRGRHEEARSSKKNKKKKKRLEKYPSFPNNGDACFGKKKFQVKKLRQKPNR